MEKEVIEPSNAVKLARNTTESPYQRDPALTQNPLPPNKEHNVKVQQAFKHIYPEQKNPKLMTAKNDALNNVIKEEMSRIIDNKETFYDLLNKKVTPEYKFVPEAALYQQQSNLFLNEGQSAYEKKLMSRQQEIVAKRM